jgi:hypothetical protein
MTANGTKQTSAPMLSMSAFRCKADIPRRDRQCPSTIADKLPVYALHPEPVSNAVVIDMRQ